MNRALQLLVSVVIGIVVWIVLVLALARGVGSVELILLLVPAIGAGWLVDRRLRRHA